MEHRDCKCIIVSVAETIIKWSCILKVRTWGFLWIWSLLDCKLRFSRVEQSVAADPPIQREHYNELGTCGFQCLNMHLPCCICCILSRLFYCCNIIYLSIKLCHYLNPAEIFTSYFPLFQPQRSSFQCSSDWMHTCSRGSAGSVQTQSVVVNYRCSCCACMCAFP